MSQTEMDQLEQELLDYFYLGDVIVVAKKKGERMKEYHKRPARCYVCQQEMKRSQIYYHLKKVHNTTAKKYLKKK